MAKKMSKKPGTRRSSRGMTKSNKGIDKPIAKKSLPQPKEVKAGLQDSELHREVTTFIQRIESLDLSIGIVMTLLMSMHKVVIDRYNNFLTNKGKRISKNKKGEVRYAINVSERQRLEELERSVDRVGLGQNIVPESFIVSLVSQFDFFISCLIRYFFTIRPELLSSTERQLSFEQLGKLGSIRKAQKYLLEKEVESVLRKSHADQFKWLENKFNVELRKDLELWPNFIELTERRNLFVHCNGIISSQYLETCRSHRVNLTDNKKLGTKLDVTPEYFKRGFRCIFEIGVKLCQVLWRKIDPDDLHNADRSLHIVTYDLLVSEQYDLAKRLLDFACSKPMKYHTDIMRRVHIINRAIAYKWKNDDEVCKEIINNEDWSACSDDFKLAVAVLLNDFKQAINIMKQIGKHGILTEVHYREWPVFKKFRKSKEFLKTFKEIYSREFGKVEVEKATAT